MVSSVKRNRRIRRRSKTPVLTAIVGVRFDEETAAELNKAAAAYGTRVSDVVRILVLGALSDRAALQETMRKGYQSA